MSAADVDVAALGITRVVADPDVDDGITGAIPRARLADARRALEEAGYQVSDSRDDDGTCWIWWARA